MTADDGSRSRLAEPSTPPAEPVTPPALGHETTAGARIWTNWARTVTAFPGAVHQPAGRDALVDVVRSVAGRGGRLKVVGGGHSPSAIAAPDPGTDLVSLARHSRVLDLDVSRDEVTVEAGIRLDALVGFLATRGWALPTLGAVTAQTVAGAVSTGSHGSGEGSLDRYLSALELVDGTGRVHRLVPEADPALFDAARTGLGALGVLSTLTLRVVPAFTLSATVVARTLDGLVEELDELSSAGRARVWWYPHTGRVLVWRAHRTAERPRPASTLRLAADRLAEAVHETALWGASTVPALMPVVNRAAATRLLTSRRTVVDTGDRVLATGEGIRRQVLEYSVGADAVRGVVAELRRAVARGGVRAPAPVELRFGPAEAGWLNPAYGRASCSVGVVGYRPFGRAAACAAWFAAAGSVLAAAGGRPHWASAHAHDAADLAGRYPRWADFADVRARLDPDGVFANAYLDRVLGPCDPGHQRHPGHQRYPEAPDRPAGSDTATR